MKIDRSKLKSLIIPTEKLIGQNYPPLNQYKFKIGEPWLYCFGINHSFNPQDKQFVELKDFIIEFIEKTNGQDNLCLLESNPLPKIEATNEEEIIKQFGERGLMVHLCQQNKIDYIFCEETTGQDINYLTELSDRQTAELVIVGRSLASLVKKGVSWDLALERSYQSLNRELLADDDEPITALGEINNKIEELRKKYQPEVTLEIFIDWLMSPMTTISPLASLRRKLSDWRNFNLVQKIIDKLDEDKNLLVVFGSAHIYQIKPVLESLTS